MLRRTLTLTALALLVASGAMAQNWKSNTTASGDGFHVQEIVFTPGNIDTANFLDAPADTLDDSLVFTSPAFAVKKPWSIVTGRMFYSTQDTVSTIDTLGYSIQAKFESDYDSTWWTLATCVKFDEDQMNTIPASANIKGYADTDSISGIGDYFRLRVAIIAEAVRVV